ncbi:MAG: hypothetical protein KC443_17600, partial [Anaerolineales bacterium]|nr:hypothetical protein [Anaerolineales bacterium]
PHHLAYFNEFVGGAAHGIDYLGDSNLDWGQDLYALVDYMADSDTAVQYSYFGSADPVAFGLTQTPLLTEAGLPQAFTPANPAPGRYALSASHLQGLWLAEPDVFDWFRHQEPTGSLGYSILLFAVPQAQTGAWVAYCLDPGPLLSATAVTDLLGVTPARSLYFDCQQSWVFPNNGQPGWYILPQQDTWPLAAVLPAQLRLVYRHAPTAVSPSYDVYYWDGDLSGWRDTLRQQATTATGDPLTLPQPMSDSLQLVGYTTYNQAWWTVWQVQSATAVPLTIAAHLYTADPQPLVADGLGFLGDQWQA